MGNVQRSRETPARKNNRAKQGKDQGKDEGKDLEEARESEETETSRINSLRVDSLEPGKWFVHGLYEEQAQKAGLRRLDKNWEAQGLDFPHNAKLLRKELLQDLISGKRHFDAVRLRDISRIQRDLSHLTLRQLLRMRVLNPDYAPLGKGAEKVQAFIEQVDALLFRMIGEAVSVSLCRFGNVNEDAQRRLGRDIAMVSEAAATLQEPCWWVCFAGHHRIWFDPTLFKVLPYFPRSCGVLEIMDNSKVDRHSKGLQRCLDWEVCLAVSEDQVSLQRLTTLAPRIPLTREVTPATVPAAPSIRFRVDRSKELTQEELKLPPWVRPYLHKPVEEQDPEALRIIYTTRNNIPYTLETMKKLIADTLAEEAERKKRERAREEAQRLKAERTREPPSEAGPGAPSQTLKEDCAVPPPALPPSAPPSQAGPDTPSQTLNVDCTVPPPALPPSATPSQAGPETPSQTLKVDFSVPPSAPPSRAGPDAPSQTLKVDCTVPPSAPPSEAGPGAPSQTLKEDCTVPPPALAPSAPPSEAGPGAPSQTLKVDCTMPVSAPPSQAGPGAPSQTLKVGFTVPLPAQPPSAPASEADPDPSLSRCPVDYTEPPSAPPSQAGPDTPSQTLKVGCTVPLPTQPPSAPPSEAGPDASYSRFQVDCTNPPPAPPSQAGPDTPSQMLKMDYQVPPPALQPSAPPSEAGPGAPSQTFQGDCTVPPSAQPPPEAVPGASSSTFQVDCTERPRGLTLDAVPDAPFVRFQVDCTERPRWPPPECTDPPPAPPPEAVPTVPSSRNEAACTDRTSLRREEDYAALLRFQASWGLTGRPRDPTSWAVPEAPSLRFQVDCTERGPTPEAVSGAPSLRSTADRTERTDLSQGAPENQRETPRKTGYLMA